MKLKLYQKYEWKIPFYIGVVLGFACLSGAFANIFSEGKTWDIIGSFAFAILMFCVAYFGGWRKKKNIDENIYNCEKYEEIQEIKEETKDVGNTA